MNLSRSTYDINTEKLSLFMWMVLAALMAFTSLSTDIYLPAMPEMHDELQGNIELTITGFLIGFSIGQIFWGPVSDKYGRRLPMALGLALFVVGSVGCALSFSIGEIILWRVIQALGACVGPMLSRAMIRDMFGQTKAAEMLSSLMIIMAMAPIIGPLLGGQIIRLSTWHSIFWMLSAVGTLMLISVIWLPKTLPQKERQQNSIGTAFGTYIRLLKNRKYMMYTLCVTFYYMAVYAFIAGSPAVYIKYFGIQPQAYGWLFGLNMIGVVVMSFANRKLVRTFKINTLLKVATAVSMMAGIALICTYLLGIENIYGIIIPVFFIFSMNGIIAACTTAAALEDVPEIAGAASALLGALQYGSGIVTTVLLAWISDPTPKTMCWILAIFTTIAALIMWLPMHKKKLQIQSNN